MRSVRDRTAPRLARPEAADPRRALGSAGGGRLQVRARADPRGRLPRRPEAAPRRSARAHGPVAAGPGGCRGRDPRTPPRRGLSMPSRARAGRRAGAGPGESGGGAAGGRGGRRAPARRSTRRSAPARARDLAPGAGCRRLRRAAPGARSGALRSRPHERRHARSGRGDRARAGRAPAGACAGGARAGSARDRDERGHRAGAHRHRRGAAAARDRGRRLRPVPGPVAARLACL